MQDVSTDTILITKPPKTKGFFIILTQFGFAVTATLFTFFLEFLLSPLIHITPFLLFPLTIAFAAWYGKLWLGIATTILSSVELALFLFRYSPLRPIDSVEQLILFCIVGLVISYIIDRCQRTNKIIEYQAREEEYNKRFSQLTEEAQKAKEEIKARDEFLSIASHELRTPLTSMLLQLQMMLHDIRNVSLANFSIENLLKMLENAEKQTHRLRKMINDLLNVSLITTGKLELEVGEADVSQIVKDVVESFSKRLEKDNVKMTLEADQPVIGHVDSLRMAQVVTNLISNAIKYGDGKPINVKVEKHGEHGKISVQDHGIGIKSEDMKRVFARFERVNISNNIKGLGVGLYITHQIVTAHHGTISVHSHLGEGTTFIVELPLKPSV